MLPSPVRPHIIGSDFIILPTHFTNCQNAKPTTARIIISLLPPTVTKKTKSRTPDFYPNDILHRHFVYTQTDEQVIEPHVGRRHVSFIPVSADILISVSAP